MSVSVVGGSLSKIMSVPDAGSGESAGGVIAGGSGVGEGDGVVIMISLAVGSIVETTSILSGISVPDVLGEVPDSKLLGEMSERIMIMTTITASTTTVVTIVRISCALFFAREELRMFLMNCRINVLSIYSSEKM